MTDLFSAQPPSRDAARLLMADFTPRMGRRYASGRNYDRGAGNHSAVSCLSPYVRRRLLTEAELVATAQDAHGLDGAEKFIQEVFWRSYFKGWLERRPGIWASYRTGLEQDLMALEADRRLRKRVDQAEAGATGIACFDAWSEELVETGYLHNHARMWFASIWIFTLGLPWRVGADFFYRHLLDGDPASNTLSWRWVAGLHTRGKVYQAKAWNISKFTNQRFTPAERDLADPVEGLDHTEPEGLPPVTPVRQVRPPRLGVPTALLITEEDCLPETLIDPALDVIATATISASHLRSDRPVAEIVADFECAALADAATRIGHQATVLRAQDPGALIRWAEQSGAQQIATAYVPEGPLRDWLTEKAIPKLQNKGIAFCEIRRSWDDAVWKYATAGFFKVKQQIPKILQVLEDA
ncbi:MAG: FAD-binding domain-containing protein [Pseudomonadota bacterium]